MPALPFDTARRFEALARLGQALTASLELPRVLEIVAASASELLPDASAWIFVAEGERLRVGAQVGVDPAAQAELKNELAFGEGLTGRVALTRVSLILEDVTKDRPLDPAWLRRQGFVSYAGVPLFAKERLVGVLTLMTRAPHHFTMHEIEVLGAFAHLAAIAIENARLYAGLSTRVRRLNALTRLNRLVSSSLDPEAVLREIANAAAELMEAKVVSFWRCDEEHGVLKRVASSNEIMRDYPRDSVPLDFGILGQVARRREAINVPDVFADERFVVIEWWKQHGLTSMLGLPVLLDGKLLAVISLNGERPFQVGPEDADLLESFAAQAAVAMRNANLFAESERRRRTAEALERTGRSLARSLEPAEVGRRTVESIGQLVPCDTALLYREEPGSGDLVLFAGTSAGTDWNQRFPRGMGAMGLALQQGQPVVTTDVRGDTRITLTPEMRAGIAEQHDRAVLAVPLVVQDRTIGALAIVAEAGRLFTEEETRLVQTFADQAALSLDNAQLLHESRTRQARLETLVDASRQLSGIQPLESLLDSIAEACGRLLGSESVGFRLLDGDDLVVTGSWGDARQVMSTPRLKVGESLSGRVAETGEPVIVTRVDDDPRVLPRHQEALRRHGYRAWLGVPVKVGHRLIGVLSIRTRQERGFSEADVGIATAFASQAAVAVDNARLYGEVQHRLRQTETLLNVSRAVSETHDLTEAMRRIAHEMGRALRADTVGAYLADPGHRTLKQVAGYNVPRDVMEEFSASPIPLAGYPLLEEAWRQREPVCSSDVPNDPRIHPSVRRAFPHRAQLFVPMVVRDRPIGGLFAIWWTEPRELTSDELRLVQGISEQGALSIANIELHFETSRRRRQAEELARLTQSLTESLDVGDVAQRVVDSVRPLFGATYARLRLLQPDGALPLLASSGEALPPGVGSLPPGVGIAGLALASGRPEWSANVVADPRFTLAEDTLRGLPARGHCALLAAPLRAKGAIIGVLTIGDRAGRKFSDDEVALLQTFADQAALALQNARLFAGQREEAEVSGALLRLARATERVADLDGMLDTVARVTPQLLGHARCSVFLFDPVDASLVLATAVGFSAAERPALSALRGTSGIPAVEEAIRSHEPVAVEDAGEGTWIPGSIASALDIASMLIIPLVSGGRLMGTMAVDTPRLRTTFSDKQIMLARSIAAHAAGAIERARLHAETARRHREAALSEQALRTSETRYRLVARATNDAIWDWDLLTNRITWNEGVQTLFGYVPEVVSGDADWWTARLHPDDRDRVVGSVRAALDGGSQTWFEEFRFHRADGSWAVVADRAYVVYEDGRPVRMLGAMADMTERRQAAEALRRSEEHVRQMQKMEAIGRLAGGIAHDFNNLLTVITGRSQLLLRRLREPDPVRQDIGLIQKTAERAGALTRQLLAFSRKQVLQPRVVDPNAVVQGLGPMLQRLLGEDVELVIEATAGARVKADPGQLEQVIVNLAVNARDAMPGGGRLVIAITFVELDEATARQHGGLPGPYVELSVTDSGVGMDAETQARIFEPFFTTKDPGQGTGLGLATVYGIVKQHQGAIAVETAPGLGTTFRIYLPATTDAAEALGGESTRGLPAGSETILVVEDEDEVRALARDILLQVGYTVLEAANGPEAIALCDNYHHTIHLLLSDVIMPQMNGQELAQRLQQARPDIKVLYMSGYTADALGPRALLAADRVLVQKPFTPDSLARRVRQAIDATSALADD
jgi:PAS domain S-box-containing protein